MGLNLIKAMKASEALIPHEGKTLMITQADRTKVGGKYLGGPGFPGLQRTSPEHANAESVWGVAAPQIATTMINANKRVPDGDVIWTSMLGSPDQHKSNPQVFQSILQKFRDASNQGGLSDDLRQAMNDRLANFFKDSKTGEPLFDPSIDILGRNVSKQADTFAKRAALADVMSGTGVGGARSGAQIFDYPGLLAKTTDPLAIEAKTGDIGTRLFTLDNGSLHRPDLHPAYPYILTGQDLGVNFVPASRDIVMKDFIDSVVNRTGRQPGVMDFTRGYAPSVQITDTMLRNLQDAGMKVGGLVSLYRRKP